jgi:hypothetical protein
MSGSGSTVAVSVMPVGSGTVELLPINGYPSLLDGPSWTRCPATAGAKVRRSLLPWHVRVGLCSHDGPRW